MTKFPYDLEVFVSDKWNTLPIQPKDVLICGFLGIRGGRRFDWKELRGRVTFTGGLWGWRSWGYCRDIGMIFWAGALRSGLWYTWGREGEGGRERGWREREREWERERGREGGREKESAINAWVISTPQQTHTLLFVQGIARNITQQTGHYRYFKINKTDHDAYLILMVWQSQADSWARGEEFCQLH